MLKWMTDFALTVCFGSRELAVMLISCVPIIELKGAIPIGIEYYGLPLATSFWLAAAGTTLVCIALLLILKCIHRWIQNKPNNIISRFENIFKKKADGINHKSGTFSKTLGVFLFAAIPLPLTGVYSASVIATLVSLSFCPAFFAIALGNLAAGFLMILLTALLGQYVNLFLYTLFVFALVLFAVFVYKLFKRKTKENINERSKPDKNIKPETTQMPRRRPRHNRT